MEITSQTHKRVRGGWGFRVELHCVGSQNAEFFVVGKANRPLTFMTYRHGGRDRFGLAEGRGQGRVHSLTLSEHNNSLQNGTF